MKLSEFQKRFGIKRIDFSKVKPSRMEEQWESDKLKCPYCLEEIEYESEEIDAILKGEPYQCPECEKWFYAEGEVTIDTTCYPMEDAVIRHRRHIESTYDHMDKCEAGGVDWPDNRYGIVEWEVYNEYARPLFENEEKEEHHEG
jgi:hypothetical protein